MSDPREIRVLSRDPVAGGSHEEWPGRLDAAGLHFHMSHPPARRLEIRFLLPGARTETRAAGEVLRVDRDGGRFEVHARLDPADEDSRASVARWLGKAGAGNGEGA